MNVSLLRDMTTSGCLWIIPFLSWGATYWYRSNVMMRLTWVKAAVKWTEQHCSDVRDCWGINARGGLLCLSWQVAETLLFKQQSNLLWSMFMSNLNVSILILQYKHSHLESPFLFKGSGMLVNIHAEYFSHVGVLLHASSRLQATRLHGEAHLCQTPRGDICCLSTQNPTSLQTHRENPGKRWEMYLWQTKAVDHYRRLKQPLYLVGHHRMFLQLLWGSLIPAV